MEIPEPYILQKLFSCATNVSFRRDNQTYNASCPICKEGSSAGKKKRLFYYTKTKSFYCFNCNKSWMAFKWIMDACNMAARDIYKEIDSETNKSDITSRIFNPTLSKKEHNTLPYDSISIEEPLHLLKYKDNNFFKKANSLLLERRLSTAINRPKKFFISLTDFKHKNRLCIPFYNLNGDIIYYQTRALDGSTPKYLCKYGEKELYGISSLKAECNYIFIFEGPIDSMFVVNGVGVLGLNITQHQQDTLNRFPFHKKIWITDNQNIDQAAKEKTEVLCKKKTPVFIWPKNINVKDFNELAVLLKQDSISHEFIIKHTINLQ